MAWQNIMGNWCIYVNRHHFLTTISLDINLVWQTDIYLDPSSAGPVNIQELDWLSLYLQMSIGRLLIIKSNVVFFIWSCYNFESTLKWPMRSSGSLWHLEVYFTTSGWLNTGIQCGPDISRSFYTNNSRKTPSLTRYGHFRDFAIWPKFYIRRY